MNSRHLYLFLGITLLLKVLIAWITPVVGDEAYYYIWSIHPQLSYFDHPPMVGWWIYLGHLFFPAGHPLSLRVMFILGGFLTSLVWIKILLEEKASYKVILIFLLFAFLNPLLGPGSVLATPDVPLVLFWSLSFWAFLNVLRTKELKWYGLLGLFLGLGFCSKYHIVLFVISGFITLAFGKRYLRLRPLGILFTLIIGALCSLPVVIWNAQNEWASFVFQINHGFGQDPFTWNWPLAYVGTQILLLNPFIVFTLFKKSQDNTDRIFTWSQLTFFFSSSLKSVVEANWPISSHLHATRHFAQHTAEMSSQKLVRYSLVYWLGIYILLAAFFMSPQSAHVRRNLVNSAQITELLPVVEKYQPLYGPSYQMSSLLTWKTQKLVPKLNELSRHDFYDSLPESKPTASSFYVLKYNNSWWPAQYEHYKKIHLESFDKLGIDLYQLSHE